MAAGELQLLSACVGLGHNGLERMWSKTRFPTGSSIPLPKCRASCRKLSRGHPSFPYPKPPDARGSWLQGSLPGADACKWVRRWVWEQPASSTSFCQHCLLGHGCLRARGLAKCDCPLAPVGAAARPMWYPAWPSLTMWQAWTAAHNRAQLPVLPAKKPDAAIGKNCFTIWNLGPLIIAQRGWRGEVQSGGLKMPASPCIHQCLLYCLLSGTILLMFSFLQPSNSCSAFPIPQGRKEKWVEGSIQQPALFWPGTPGLAPVLGWSTSSLFQQAFSSGASDSVVVISQMLSLHELHNSFFTWQPKCFIPCP